VEAQEALSGSYAFRLEKRGGTGRSDVTQGGDFSLRAGEARTVQTVFVSLGRGESLTAELGVETQAGRDACELRYPPSTSAQAERRMNKGFKAVSGRRS